MIVETEEVADQLFMDDKEEQLVKKATKMKSNWCTLLALSSAYLFFLPSLCGDEIAVFAHTP